MKRGKTLSINLDLEKMMGLAPQLPNIAAELAKQGVPVPPQLAKAVPFISAIAGIANKFLDFGDDTGLSAPGLPDPGPLGKGAAIYLRTKDSYTDADVARAAAMVLEAPLPGIETVKGALEYTLSLLYPGVSIEVPGRAPTREQYRVAVDRVLAGNALPEAMNDRFGDMILYTLKTIIEGRKGAVDAT